MIIILQHFCNPPAQLLQILKRTKALPCVRIYDLLYITHICVCIDHYTPTDQKVYSVLIRSLLMHDTLSLTLEMQQVRIKNLMRSPRKANELRIRLENPCDSTLKTPDTTRKQRRVRKEGGYRCMLPTTRYSISPRAGPFVMSAGGRASGTWRSDRLTGRNGRESRPHVSAGSANMSQNGKTGLQPLPSRVCSTSRGWNAAQSMTGGVRSCPRASHLSLSRAGVNPCESSAVVFDHARYSQVEPPSPEKKSHSSDLLHQFRNIFCKEPDGRYSLGIHPDLSRIPPDHHVPVV